MTAYYAQRLSARRLSACYELAGPRIQRYLEQEIVHLLERVSHNTEVLELGCGYGRVALRLAAAGAQVVGIDVADESLLLAREQAAAAGLAGRCRYLTMDATALDFDDESFDIVACVQNGIAAFRVDPQRLVAEAWRVLRPGGRLLLSTYAEAIWPERLAWFEAQAAHGLLGAVDRVASRDGVVVCADGFRSGRASAAELAVLAEGLGVQPCIEEIDTSSLWCEMRKAHTMVHSSSTGAALPHRPTGDRRP
jgi:ubiquinone/menaquinone biosynthesis C-methylase UbiE